MKTPRKPNPPARQLPKAGIRYMDAHGVCYNHCASKKTDVVVAVLPLPAAQAKALVKNVNLGEEKVVEEVAKQLSRSIAPLFGWQGAWGRKHECSRRAWRKYARSVLHRLGLVGKGVGR